MFFYTSTYPSNVQLRRKKVPWTLQEQEMLKVCIFYLHEYVRLKNNVLIDFPSSASHIVYKIILLKVKNSKIRFICFQFSEYICCCYMLV